MSCTCRHIACTSVHQPGRCVRTDIEPSKFICSACIARQTKATSGAVCNECHVPDTEFYSVTIDDTGERHLEAMADVSSVLELAPGLFVAKPVQEQGCWLNAVSFQVLSGRLWEQQQ